MAKRVLIIGGYGNFGALAAERLAMDPNIQLIIAGRSAEKAEALAKNLKAARSVGIAIFDYRSGLEAALEQHQPDIVLHTSGPFQGQDYAVAKACIAAGCHYLDLADARAFVPGITALDEEARANDLLVISGASSVPGLSSAIIDQYLPGFQELTSVEYGIGTAQRTSRGLATTEAVLSYAGEPFETLKDGHMQPVYGWQDFHFRKLPGLGWRGFANCDIPDLSLLPARYPSLQTVRFYAGLEVKIMQVGLWLMSWGHRLRLLPNLKRLARPLLGMSRWFDHFGGDDSLLFMTLSGKGTDGQPRKIRFQVTARKGDGLNIPITPAVILIKKLATDSCKTRGAIPCMGLVSLEEIKAELADLRVEWIATEKA
ncbi:saccharopine dehydrogenase family protein [Kordiimonas marina]|uniref:saccharopine dehydrogenase family protein n=1 Tax=Kordiimonas marina TaxID=2872312 RepID=UPI001FF6E6FF|nr:saccharopine dehydrogenase NADP-binding domain-containing protein [Kordiimonas marina]MCJ9429938.1 saccharopine dehydrogenase NADP-binding domain-containing protein [Kordiimonas marina]